jgi:hypothetical protein
MFYDKNQSFFRFFFREGRELTIGFLEREGESILLGEKKGGWGLIS